MDTDLETFGFGLNIEIAVHSGDTNGVHLTTMVSVPDYRNRIEVGAKLRAIIALLRDALPLAELAGADRDYKADKKSVRVAVVDKQGVASFVTQTLLEAQAGQVALQKTLAETKTVLKGIPGANPEPAKP